MIISIDYTSDRRALNKIFPEKTARTPRSYKVYIRTFYQINWNSLIELVLLRLLALLFMFTLVCAAQMLYI